MIFDIELDKYMWTYSEQRELLPIPYANLILGDMSIEIPAHLEKVMELSYLDANAFIRFYRGLNKQAGGNDMKMVYFEVVDNRLVISMEFE